ncbi:MAG: hypothetical protein AB1791_14085 [Chloroflexota bacterium]
MRQRDLFWFWLPLFASWLLMTAEGPIISAVINRLPTEVVMLAAQGIVVSLSVTIESPIINLLATSTALSKDRHSFLLLRRFTLHGMVLLTAVSVLIGFTPLFNLVVQHWMGAPAEVAQWVRPGLRIMALWSAAIAWRRFLQGVLIRFNQTGKVAWGTVVRLAASAGTVLFLAVVWGRQPAEVIAALAGQLPLLSPELPGVLAGATALMAGVIAEALYATIAVRPLLRREFGPTAPAADGPPLTYRQLFWFHLPLASTSVLILFVQPIVAFSLARLEHPTESLAAWPVVFQVMLIMRAIAFALPEVVIAQSNGEATWRPIRRFSLSLTAASTLLMALLVFTPLLNLYLYGVQDVTPEVGALARSGLLLFLLLPGLAVLTSWLRGLLIKGRATQWVNLGMVVNLLVTIAVLAGGMVGGWPGVNTAAVALVVAAAVELAYLWWHTHRLLEPARKESWTGFTGLTG